MVVVLSVFFLASIRMNCPGKYPAATPGLKKIIKQSGTLLAGSIVIFKLMLVKAVKLTAVSVPKNLYLKKALSGKLAKTEGAISKRYWAILVFVREKNSNCNS